MTPVFAARKRAEEFHELIERATTADAADLADTRFAELSHVLTTLRTAAPVAPDADFAVDLRGRLMAAAAEALAVETPEQVRARRPAPRRSGRDKKVAAALAGFAIVSASASMAVAAQSALPGDTLYPLKRALENAHAGVQSGDDKGATLIDSASGRLDEVDRLSRDGSGDPAVISQTLQAFAEQAAEASQVLLGDYQSHGDVASIQQLRSFTADSMAELKYLEQFVPSAARPSLISASQVLSQIDQQALDACPGCAADITMAPTLTSSGVPEILQSLVGAPDATTASTRHEPSTAKSPHRAHHPSGKHDHVGSTTPDPTSGESTPPSTSPGTQPGTPVTPPKNPLHDLTHHLVDPAPGTGKGSGKQNTSNHGLGGALGELVGGVNQAVKGLTDGPSVP